MLIYIFKNLKKKIYENYKLKTKLLFVIFDIHVKCNFLTDIEKKVYKPAFHVEQKIPCRKILHTELA